MHWFRVVNFERFQHYKDRSPPWIKLYNELLDDYQFGLLQDASKAHLIAIWLLASRSDNRLPYDGDWIGKRISAQSSVDLDVLQQSGFIERIEDCSEALAECKQSAIPEREGEGETELTTPPSEAADAAPDPDLLDPDEPDQLAEPSKPMASERAPPVVDLTPPLHLLRAVPSDPGQLKALVFGQCLTWLAGHADRKRESLRALLGKWCRDHGDGNTVEAVMAAARDSPADPVSWIEHRLQGKRPKYAPQQPQTQTGLSPVTERYLRELSDEHRIPGAEASDDDKGDRPNGGDGLLAAPAARS